jgi:hypothetical protein
VRFNELCSHLKKSLKASGAGLCPSNELCDELKNSGKASGFGLCASMSFAALPKFLGNLAVLACALQ